VTEAANAATLTAGTVAACAINAAVAHGTSPVPSQRQSVGTKSAHGDTRLPAAPVRLGRQPWLRLARGAADMHAVLMLGAPRFTRTERSDLQHELFCGFQAWLDKAKS
jgi:hypothetical protein